MKLTNQQKGKSVEFLVFAELILGEVLIFIFQS